MHDGNLVGQEILGYRLTKLLGQGRFADVYLGEHATEGEAAIKVLKTELTYDAFPHLLNQTSIFGLCHPNILPIRYFAVKDHTAFLVMDYASKGSLRHRFPRGALMPLHIIVPSVKQIASALQYAHERGVIHRDVKPENLLLGPDDQVLLSDFSLAISAEDSPESFQKAGGTVEYMAPEQVQGRPCPASDQYSLGIVVYEWLCGTPPFTGQASQVAFQQVHTPPPSLRSKVATLTPQVERVMLKVLEKSPDKRFKTVEVFANALELAYRADETVSEAAQPGEQLRKAPEEGSPPSTGPGPLQLPFPIGYPAGLLKGRRRWSLLLLLSLLIIFLVAGLLASYAINRAGVVRSGRVPVGIGVTQAQNGEDIGISDGSFAFDTTGPGGVYKREAADRLKAHDSSGAQSYWEQALRQDSSDAEALIYLEDQRVLASGRPYITIVVGTILTGSNLGVGRYNLQGAYVAQKEYNEAFKLPAGRQVRLLIANAGSQTAGAAVVAKQIVQVAHTDPTFVGVMGWPLSDPTLAVLHVLQEGQTHIPLVSSAGSDALTGKAPYFFRVSVPSRVQASAAAAYAEQTLHTTRAVVFKDPHNSYSNSLAIDFSEQFTHDGNMVVATEQYTVGKPETLVAPLQDAQHATPAPDLIYFAGYASDASTLLTDLPTAGPFANVAVLGPNSLYELQGYQTTAGAALSHLRLTAFAYPDEWQVLASTAQEPKFFADYANSFDPNRFHQGSPYGYTRPNADAMLSYDAMLAILSASNIGLAGGKQRLTPSDLQTALTKITASQAIQGVSGQISFGSDGNATNKEVLILCVSKDIRFHLVEAYGQFLVGGPIQTLREPASSCS